MKKNDPQKRSDLPSPKRGAFPTPREEIEKATPYVPKTEPKDDQTSPERDSPRNADQPGSPKRSQSK
jgi:hypothetical protein